MYAEIKIITSVFSDGEIVGTYLPRWCSTHPGLVTSRPPSPGNWVAFHLKRKQLMACAGEVCTKEAEHGVDPKGYMCPLSLPVHSLGWGVDRVGGAWSAPNFSKQLVFGLSHCPQGPTPHPLTPHSLPSNWASPSVIGCFPWSWLKSA